MKNNKRGGARKGAGRKPMKDKKQPVTIWLRPSEMQKMGGVQAVKILIYDVILESHQTTK